VKGGSIIVTIDLRHKSGVIVLTEVLGPACYDQFDAPFSRPVEEIGGVEVDRELALIVPITDKYELVVFFELLN